MTLTERYQTERVVQMRRIVLLAIVIPVTLAWTCAGQEKASNPDPAKPGVVTEHP
jgi:hypothetical protein